MEEFLNINYHQILHGLVKRIGQEIHLIFPTSSAIFSVLVDDQNYIKEINIKNIAAFTETEAIQYAQMAVQKDKK